MGEETLHHLCTHYIPIRTYSGQWNQEQYSTKYLMSILVCDFIIFYMYFRMWCQFGVFPPCLSISLPLPLPLPIAWSLTWQRIHHLLLRITFYFLQVEGRRLRLQITCTEFLPFLSRYETLTCPNEIHLQYKYRRRHTEKYGCILHICHFLSFGLFCCSFHNIRNKMLLENSRWIQLRNRDTFYKFEILPEFNSIFYSLPCPINAK